LETETSRRCGFIESHLKPPSVCEKDFESGPAYLADMEGAGAISALAATSLGAATWIANTGYWWPNEIDHPICAWILNGTAWNWTCGV
jgi:hypothetical protein